MTRFAAILLILLAVAPRSFGQPHADARSVSGREWFAGAFSFSDEMGGFSILSVTGSGSRDNPILVVQELGSATPVTLVIRAFGRAAPFTATVGTDRNIIYMMIATVNTSGIPWVEFEFELQKEFPMPSVFGDGLSFDQANYDRDGVSSDSFVRFHDDYEPYDRLRFSKGRVDPLETARFRFVITDFNPREIFYLRQDPRIPLG